MLIFQHTLGIFLPFCYKGSEDYEVELGGNFRDVADCVTRLLRYTASINRNQANLGNVQSIYLRT